MTGEKTAAYFGEEGWDVGGGETAASSALEFWLSFQNPISPQTLGFQLGQAVLKVGVVQPTTLR